MPRKTILIRCQAPDCHELAPKGIGWCDTHKKTKPHKCLDCDTIIFGKAERCTLHALEHHRARDTAYKQRERKEDLELKSVVVAKPQPRKPVKIVKTTEQVDRECRKEEKRLREVFTTLNPRLLELRNLRGACVSVVY